jgi:hypothetical protein
VGERTRWFIDFAARSPTNKAPLHLVLDEAHNFAPQGKVMDPDAGKMLHAANRWQRRALARHPARHDHPAPAEAAQGHADERRHADRHARARAARPRGRRGLDQGLRRSAQGKEVLNSLASLQRGEGWVWYPEGGFLSG